MGADRSRYGYDRHLEKVVGRCGERWIILSQTDLLGKQYMMSPSTCKSNYCPDCRQKNLRALRRRLYDGIKAHRWRLVTLTFPQDESNRTEILRTLRRTFQRFLKRIKRQYSKFSFVRTLEIHQSGYPHIHMIVNRYIPIAFLQVHWKEVGGGFVDIRARKQCRICKRPYPCEHGNKPKYLGYREAAHYLTEEMEKVRQDPHQLGFELWETGIRTFASSRDLKINESKSPWKFERIVRSAEEAWTEYETLVQEAIWNNQPIPGVEENSFAMFAGVGVGSVPEDVQKKFIKPVFNQYVCPF